jgi:transposase-like protein
MPPTLLLAEKKKKHAWTVKEKIAAINMFKQNNNKSLTCRLKGCEPNQLRKWLQHEQELRNMPNDAKRRVGAGRKPLLSKSQEDAVYTDYKNHRRNKRRITTKFIRALALSTIPNGSTIKFHASRGWYRRFSKRHNLTRRKATKKSLHKMTDVSRKDKVFKYILAVHEEIEKHSLDILKNNWNIDQTRVFMDMTGNFTVADKGASFVEVGTNGGEKEGVTITLGANAAGDKLNY